MGICKQCENILGLSAMQFTECEKCKTQVVTPHIPAYKYCDKCGEELNVCIQCGKPLKER